MAQRYEPIYSYQSNRSAIAGRNQAILRLVALLTFIAVSSVIFLSITDYVYWRQSQPRSHLSSAPAKTSQRIQFSETMASTSTSATPAANGSSSSSKAWTLDEYLVQAKENAYTHLKAGSSSQDGKLTLIMGNEAGDLDSAACAIGLSYLLSRFGPPPNVNLSASSYVPLIQSLHTDDVLRPENTAAFAASGIKPDHVLFLDDLQQTLGLSLDSDAFSSKAGVALGWWIIRV